MSNEWFEQQFIDERKELLEIEEELSPNELEIDFVDDVCLCSELGIEMCEIHNSEIQDEEN